MPIELIPADNVEIPVGETASPEASEEPALAEPTEVAVETAPVKRGRGRPAGSKNKPKEAAAPMEPPPVERRPRAPRAVATPPVEEPPPPPKPVERRPRAPRKPREYVEEPESPPETPRSYRARVQREYREVCARQHLERCDHFNSMVNRFMH